MDDDIKADYERFLRSRVRPTAKVEPPKPREFTAFGVIAASVLFGLAVGVLIGWAL